MTHDRRAELIIEDVAGHRRATGRVEHVQVREPASEDDDVRVENVDDVGERTAEVIDVAREDGTGSRISSGGAHGDLRRRARHPARGAVRLLEGRAGEQRLDAATASAVAGGARRIDGVVAPLARDVLRAGPHAPFLNDAAPHPRPADDSEDEAVPSPAARIPDPQRSVS